MTSQIFVALDFESDASELIAHAKAMAEKLDTEVVLVHVYMPPVMGPALPPALAAEIRDEATAVRRRLDALAATSGGLASRLLVGEPAPCLLGLIADAKPLLIVMGTHGRRGLRRLALGSVAEEVIRGSDAPVLTLRSRVSEESARSAA